MRTFSESDIITYDNVFEEQEYNKIIENLSLPKWRYGHSSDRSRKDAIPFWIMELNDNDLFTKTLLDKIKLKTNKNLSLNYVYANGHTYGTKGRLHQDSYDETGYTFLYYPNSAWDLEWQGKTTFVLDQDKYYYNLPKPNSAILFPGMIWHYAEETSRLFTGLRITIAWKLLLEE